MSTSYIYLEISNLIHLKINLFGAVLTLSELPIHRWNFPVSSDKGCSGDDFNFCRNFRRPVGTSNSLPGGIYIPVEPPPSNPIFTPPLKEISSFNCGKWKP